MALFRSQVTSTGAAQIVILDSSYWQGVQDHEPFYSNGTGVSAMPNTWGSTKRAAVVWVVGLTSILLAALSVLVSLRSRYWYPRIYAFWVIAPPSWFFIEYHFVFDRKNEALPLQQLQTAQDIAQKFWAALLVLLAGIGYFQWNLTLH